jgi:ABC-2 type transport system permease protein
VAFLISVLTSILPTFILSGFVFPVRNMPAAIQLVTYLIPAKYFLVALRAIILKGAGIAAFWEQILLLALFAALTLGLSVFMLRSRRET